MYITPYLYVMLMKLKMEVTCLGLEYPLTSLFAHLSLDNYLCSYGYPILIACEDPFIWWCNHKG